MPRTSLYAVACAAAAAAAHLDVHVCCGCGHDARSGSDWSAALNTLPAALERVTQLRRSEALAAQSQQATIRVAGKCRLDRTLELGPNHSHIHFLGVDGIADAPEISLGTPLAASQFEPVTDPAVLARLPPTAKGNVLQLDLAAAGITNAGNVTCRPYEGTDAGILPNLIQPTGLELFWMGDPNSPAGVAGPLELARYPNRPVLPTDWTHLVTVLDKTAPARAVVDNATAARLAAWAVELERDPTSIYAHYNNPIGWADLHLPITAIVPAANQVTVSPCLLNGADSGWDSIEVGAYLYTYNLLPELDAEGEYVVDRVANMLYVWPPSGPSSPIWQYAPWGMPVMPAEGAGLTAGAKRGSQVGGQDDTIAVVTASDGDLLRLVNTSFLSFTGVTMGYARGIGLVIANSTSITLTDCTIVNVGAMAVNISDGSGVTFTSVLVRGAGNGGIYNYAGDRASLAPSGNTFNGTSISYCQRYMTCYVPLLAFGGVGMTMTDSEVWGQAHMGIYASGNNNALLNSYVHDVVQTVRDSGALYTGRDWTYRGNVIAGNRFTRINSIFQGDDVSAVYLDDSASGFTITGNAFTNVSRALLLGGGRDNVFANNSVHLAEGTDAAIHFDNRDMGWAASACNASTTPPGILVQFLERVPYNTSAAWMAAYPHLPSILSDDPCLPKYNAIVGNTICDRPGLQWIDANNATIASWGSTAWGNANTTCAS